MKNQLGWQSGGGSGGSDPALVARVAALENTILKVYYYGQITSVSGTISKPTGATILLDQWSTGEDALVCSIVGGKPTFLPGTTIVSSFDIAGNYTLSGALPSNPAALIYVFEIKRIDFDSYVDPDFIIQFVEIKIQPDWNQANIDLPDYIKNKPTIPAAQIQSDWNQANNTLADYIKNKPTIPNPLLLPYDATIGVGGDYTNIGTAQTAGKYRLKAVGDIADNGASITISNNMIVDLNGFTLTITNFVYSITSPKTLEIYNGIILLNGNAAGGSQYFGAAKVEQLFIHDCTINCNQTLDSASLLGTGRLSRCMFNMGTAKYGCGFGSSVGGLINANDITLNINSSGSLYCISLGNGSTLSNLTIGGTAPTNADGVLYMAPTDMNSPAIVSNIVLIVNFTVNIKVRAGIVTNIRKTTGTINFKQSDGGGSGVAKALIKDSYLSNIPNDGSFVGGNFRYENCTFPNAIAISIATCEFYRCQFMSTFSSTSNNNIAENCNFASTVGLTGDYGKFNFNTVTGVLTFNSGAEYNVGIGNTLTAGYVDNSGNQTNEIKSNI